MNLAAARRIPPPVALAAGTFDVLRGEQVRELECLKSRASSLLVVVLPGDGAILDQHSRAELVAALRAVDYVLPADQPGPEAICQSLRPAVYLSLEAADARRRRLLIEHVHRRQAC